MPVTFKNFDYPYLNENGKWVFVPSDDGRAIGQQVKDLVEDLYSFDPFYFHFREGGHVAALHAHREHAAFARVDIKNFFYSIKRNRVGRALKACGVRRHEHFAKWSTVRNPYPGGGYVLPYGFVQSPILSSLVLSESMLGSFLRAASKEVTVSVFFDDIGFSSDDPDRLQEVFDAALREADASGFEVHPKKVAAPASSISLFNCDLSTGRAVVQEARRDEFYSGPRSAPSKDAFERYCGSVAKGNAP